MLERADTDEVVHGASNLRGRSERIAGGRRA